MTNPKFDRTLTVRSAANYLGLSASTLNKLRCTGSGPVYFKLGRAVRYDPQDLDNWLAARRVSSTSQSSVGKTGA
jgi:excisionase family DNA binding protein